jgi:pSer/pThr/pTyr-binding forkhead associated (FHA) protein
MLHAVLKVVGGKQDGKLIPLNTKKFLIGREQDCHLRPGSESVSRHHCLITIDDFTVRVRDLGSSNGTIINGKRIIGVHEANPGEALQVGNLNFEIVFSKAGAPVASGAAEKVGTSFVLDDFDLEEAEPVSDTATMLGSDTAVISKKELEADAANQASDALAAAEPVEEQSTEVAEPEPQATGESNDQAVEVPAAAAAPAAEVAATDQPSPSTPEMAPQPAEVPAAQQQPMQHWPMQQPGYPQPAPPAMPGYGQQMPQQPYPYGMPQPGMPQQGYPYGMPQPGMPGYGMPQPGMPGYGMPQQPAMPYPQQQMPYPVAQPVADEYDDDDEGESEESSKIQEPPTSLPDPAETGAVDEAKSDADDDAPKVEAPNPAADILKKYMGGR